MRRTKLAALLALALSLVLSAGTAQADILKGAGDWSVTFTDAKKMVSNFKTRDIDDVITGMQPGDTAQIELALTNQYSETTDWYMTNKVLYSLEDRSKDKLTSGGAYTYHLAYTDPDGKETVLYDSDTVGGETISPAGEGLHEATSALQDYFFLDELKKGQSGKISLSVSLDGETQGNDYQDTLADLQMNFAVELGAAEETTASSSTTSRPRTPDVVRTGDDNNLTTWYILGGISGALLLCLGFWSLFARKKDEKGGQR